MLTCSSLSLFTFCLFPYPFPSLLSLIFSSPHYLNHLYFTCPLPPPLPPPFPLSSHYLFQVTTAPSSFPFLSLSLTLPLPLPLPLPLSFAFLFSPSSQSLLPQWQVFLLSPLSFLLISSLLSHRLAHAYTDTLFPVALTLTGIPGRASFPPSPILCVISLSQAILLSFLTFLYLHISLCLH